MCLFETTSKLISGLLPRLLIIYGRLSLWYSSVKEYTHSSILLDCLLGKMHHIPDRCVFQELSRFISNLQFLLIIRPFAKSCFIYDDFSPYLYSLVLFRRSCISLSNWFTSGHFLFIWLCSFGSFIHYPLLCFSNTHSQFNCYNWCFWHTCFYGTGHSVYGPHSFFFCCQNVIVQ